ncbi:methyltransferase-like protein 27 isoform X1 [Pecten maximus]|uniref:methyltransferase-like protein 27 isoform X1 n=1 Tax=Pecten maximus TaxID=6579 RepID=UPI00145861C5|nr:methyltransferase-like protein 27 isoform X1 [Pecten maximus]XP_033734345.1 methyltransferase-like protein 27 isoform X1 [Pecten maximus]
MSSVKINPSDWTVYTSMDSTEKIEYYNEIASMYDTDYGTDRRRGPFATAAALGACVKDENQRKSVRILDVAAGTGIVGEELQKLGFTEIDALDPSPGMLDHARKKGVYTNFLCQFLTEKPCDIQTGSYDCVVMCSAIGSGHVPAEAFLEIQRITRPGGFVVLAANAKDLHKDYGNCRQEFCRLFDTLEAHGKWVKVTEKTFPCYNGEIDGILMTFRVC